MRVYVRGKDEGITERDLNRREAIRQRCLDCSAWSPVEVEGCRFSDCPLHPYRSGKGKQNPRDRAQAIREYCKDCCAGQRYEVLKCPCVDCPLWPFRRSKLDRSKELYSQNEK